MKLNMMDSTISAVRFKGKEWKWTVYQMYVRMKLVEHYYCIYWNKQKWILLLKSPSFHFCSIASTVDQSEWLASTSARPDGTGEIVRSIFARLATHSFSVLSCGIKSEIPIGIYFNCKIPIYRHIKFTPTTLCLLYIFLYWSLAL